MADGPIHPSIHPLASSHFKFLEPWLAEPQPAATNHGLAELRKALFDILQ